MSTWVNLTDTPGSISALELVRGNAGGTDLEFLTTATLNALLDHGTLAGLADDDHTQYLLLAGRAGGQVAVGGTALAEQLDLRGSSDALLGRVHSVSPFEIDFASNSAEQTALRWEPTFTQSTSYVGGFIRSTADVTYTNATFIFGLLQDFGQYRAGVAPGFAAHTLFNAVGVISNSGNFDLVQSLVLNAGMTHERATSGTSTTVQTVGVSFVPQTRALVSGAVMTRSTGMTGIRVAPTFSTVAGSTVNLGTIRGLHCGNPAVALFQPQAGTENMTAYYGVDFDNITFGGTTPVAVVRSNLAAGTGQNLILNTGGAHSEFGAAHLFDVGIVQHLGDGIFFSSSYGAAGGDVTTYWDGSSYVMDPATGDTLEFAFATNAATITGAGTSHELRLAFDRGIHFGAGSLGNQVFNFPAATRTTTVAGEWSDVLLTNAGNLTIDDAMTGVHAWTINSISLTSGTGSITGPISTLNVGGMTTSGVGTNETMGLRAAGRSQFRGARQLVPINPAQLTGTIAAWDGLLTSINSNSSRGWGRLDIAAGAPGATIQGINAGQAQDGDMYVCTVVSGGSLQINNQDGAAAAADRVITGTGGNVTIALDESFTIIYDATTARWRIRNEP